jgi:hypothetical protein
MESIREMMQAGNRRLLLNLNDVRHFNPEMAQGILDGPAGVPRPLPALRGVSNSFSGALACRQFFSPDFFCPSSQSGFLRTKLRSRMW